MARFDWNDSLGGSILIDKISARTTGSIVFGDAAHMNAGATVNGTLNANSSNLQNIRGVNAVFAKDNTGIGLHTFDATLALEIQDNANLIAHQNLDVRGNITCSGTITSLFFVAGKIDMTDLSILTSKGRVGFSVSRPSGQSIGIKKLQFDEDHPGGNADYLITTTNQNTGHIQVWESPSPRVSDFHVVVFNTGNQLADSTIHFFVV